MKEFIYIVEEYESEDYCGIANAKGIVGAFKNKEMANIVAKGLRKENGNHSGLFIIVYSIELQ